MKSLKDKKVIHIYEPESDVVVNAKLTLLLQDFYRNPDNVEGFKKWYKDKYGIEPDMSQAGAIKEKPLCSNTET